MHKEAQYAVSTTPTPCWNEHYFPRFSHKRIFSDFIFNVSFNVPPNYNNIFIDYYLKTTIIRDFLVVLFTIYY